MFPKKKANRDGNGKGGGQTFPSYKLWKDSCCICTVRDEDVEIIEGEQARGAGTRMGMRMGGYTL